MLGLHLATALEYLQSHGLIHRDIKPSNVIFVNGIPKLADVGLVTEIASQGRRLTYVGTEGYIPPEGPGTAAGDVYSLGKVLYEASMGRDRLQYPDLPTSVVEGTGRPELLRLNQVILKACEATETALPVSSGTARRPAQVFSSDCSKRNLRRSHSQSPPPQHPKGTFGARVFIATLPSQAVPVGSCHSAS